MIEHIKIALKGGLIGIANIIPGVSGGTMAVVLGVYEDLIEAIGNYITNRQKRRRYTILLLEIGAGALIMVAVFSWLMDFLLTYYSVYTYLFFIGLIAGSIPAIYKAHTDMKPTVLSFITFSAGVAIILLFALAFPKPQEAANLGSIQYEITAANISLLLIGGVFAGGSMIVPGISGSFVLVLLGQYAIVIKAIKELNITVLAVVAIGVTAGIWGFAKLIDIFLKKFPKETFYFILGLVVASLYPIFPGLPTGAFGIAIAALLIVCGGGLALLLGDR